MMGVKLSAIVAMSQNRVIGVQGQLPWRIPKDLKWFRSITSGHTVIMGRKTFESMGRVLPNRKNIIISRNPDFQVEGAWVYDSLDKALQNQFEPGKLNQEEVFIIGGSELYRLAFSKLSRIYLTLIHSDFSGDTFFPEFDWKDFIQVSREDHSEPPVSFSFLVLDRRF